MAGDRDVWRAQRPIAGQAIQRVSKALFTLATIVAEVLFPCLALCK